MVPYGLEIRAGDRRSALSPRRDILSDLKSISCAVCGAPDCGAALRAGFLPPQRVVFDWTQRFHDLRRAQCDRTALGDRVAVRLLEK